MRVFRVVMKSCMGGWSNINSGSKSSIISQPRGFDPRSIKYTIILAIDFIPLVSAPSALPSITMQHNSPLILKTGDYE
jgi:hypothetical protein